jgi:hypothetical protein
MNKLSLLGNTNLSIRLNRAHGRKVRTIYRAPFSPTVVTNLTYSRSQPLAANQAVGSIYDSVVEYYTSINGMRTTQFNIVSGLEYIVQRRRLQGSCISTSKQFYQNWCHEEDFTQGSIVSNLSGVEISTEDVGLLLENKIKYDIAVTCGSDGSITGVNVPHYIFSVCIKDLHITPAGITLL